MGSTTGRYNAAAPTLVDNAQIDYLRVDASGALVISGMTADANGSQIVTQGASPAAAVAPSSAQTTVAASSIVLKGSAGNLYGYDVCAGASAGYLLIFDATSAPADGTVTPKKVHAVAANASLSRSFNPPIRFGTGITLVFSTTGPFTKTASATAFLAGEYA